MKDFSPAREGGASEAALAAGLVEQRSLIDYSSDLIAQYGADAKTLQVSPSVQLILGFSPEELIGTSAYDVIVAEDAPLLKGEIARQLAAPGSPSKTVEIRKRRKDGRLIWVSANMKVLTSPGTGEYLGVVSVCRDISIEREARDELKRREEQFRSLTKLSADWYWESDVDGRLTFVSESVKESLGLGPVDFIGRKRTDFAVFEGDFHTAYHTAHVQRLPFRELQCSSTDVNGDVRFMRVSGEPRFEDGQFCGYRGVSRNVTSEVLARRHAESLAAAHHALIENSLDIIALLDAQGRFVRINRAILDVMGYEPQECIGKNYRDFLDPAEQNRVEQAELKLLAGSAPLQDFEAKWFRKDGTIARLSFSARWSSVEKGMYVSARDVTARYAVKDVLERSNARLSAILESIGDAFFALDANWRITYVNDKTAAFVSRPSSELLGQVMWDVVPEVVDSPFWHHYRNAMQTRQAVSCEGIWQVTGQWLDVRIYPFEDGIAVYFHDASKRRERQQAVESSERRFREMVELTPAAYLETDGSGQTTDVNDALCAISGYSREELLGQGFDKLFKSCPWAGIAFIRNGPRVAHGMEATVAHKLGHEVHVLLNARIARDGVGDALGLTAFMTDITDRKKVEGRLEHLANYDALTGLPNRTSLVVRADALLGQKDSDAQVGVFFLDVDRFKEVNDSFGHDRGDELLKEIGARLRRNLRPSDFVARIGGDEFVIIAACSSGRDAAESIAQKLLRSLSKPVRIETQDIYVSASIGIGMYPEDGRTRELLFKNADIAMYRAKAAGRNCFRFFSEEMASEAKIRLSLDAFLRRALPAREFCLHYQPRTSLDTMRVTGFEALIRWNHPELGLINPARFIPIAEANGLIESIGAWVIEQACLDAARVGRSLGRQLRVSVNVSAVQFRNPSIVSTVERILHSTGLYPPLLELELTESVLIEDIGKAAATLRSLKALGVGLSVDDFGTGYSALTYLRRFPMDVLKLDRSFITEKEQGLDGRAFIKAFVDMAHSLGMSVVAEGVESADILHLLRSVSCDEAQGFHLAPPMACDRLEEYLKVG